MLEKGNKVVWVLKWHEHPQYGAEDRHKRPSPSLSCFLVEFKIQSLIEENHRKNNSVIIHNPGRKNGDK